MSVFLENVGGVADHGYAWRNILGHDRAHADDGVRADRQILADDRAQADLGAIAYPNIAAAAPPAGEGDKIGRMSWLERVCADGLIAGGALSLQIKNIREK